MASEENRDIWDEVSDIASGRKKFTMKHEIDMVSILALGGTVFLVGIILIWLQPKLQ